MSEGKNMHLPAKMCYNHLGGKLGALLVEAFIEKGWIAKANEKDKHFFITDKGEQGFRQLGIDLDEIPVK